MIGNSINSYEGSLPRRADAQRNRDRLIDVARVSFTASPSPVPLEHIARQAGVGIATLYRHFPTRESLVEAVYAAELDELTAMAGSFSRVWRLMTLFVPGQANTRPSSWERRVCSKALEHATGPTLLGSVTKLGMLNDSCDRCYRQHRTRGCRSASGSRPSRAGAKSKPERCGLP
ncbi:TetR/AcrR family transcriptional regulator [Arthrobacter sp. SA17]